MDDRTQDTTADAIIPEDVIGEWLRSIEVSSEETERSYRTGLKALERYITEKGLNLDQLTEDDLLDFKQELLARLSPGTVSTYLIGIRSFYRWADNPAFPDIASRIKGASAKKDFKKEILTPEQAKRMLEKADGDTVLQKRNYAILNLMLRTGLRDIEIVRADVGDIDQKSGKTILYVHGKGRLEKDDFVLLAKETLEPIERYLDMRPEKKDTDPLFVSTSKRNPNSRLTTRTISGIAKQAMRAIGINSPRYTAHSLRHSAITYALMAGASLEETQQMARHTDITTTMIYSHHVDRIKNAAEFKIGNILDAVPNPEKEKKEITKQSMLN